MMITPHVIHNLSLSSADLRPLSRTNQAAYYPTFPASTPSSWHGSYTIVSSLDVRVLPLPLLLTMDLPPECDVLVVGSGNAGFCAAISAAQSGAQKAIIIYKCTEEWAGGNPYFTAGAFRTVHNGLGDLLALVNSVNETTARKIEMTAYTEVDFTGDMKRVTGNRTGRDLCRALVTESNSTVKWLAAN